tara:strand:+ start:180 stop:434 length:255 start_codon:yes stop_codon:yes gene_type:complete
MLSYGKQDFAMRTSLLVVVQKQDAKRLVLAPPCPMEGVGCMGERVRVPELQKVSKKVKRQTGNMGDAQQKLFASEKIPWLLDGI